MRILRYQEVKQAFQVLLEFDKFTQSININCPTPTRQMIKKAILFILYFQNETTELSNKLTSPRLLEKLNEDEKIQCKTFFDNILYYVFKLYFSPLGLTIQNLHPEVQNIAKNKARDYYNLLVNKNNLREIQKLSLDIITPFVN